MRTLKSLAILAILSTGFLSSSTGCATPAYSAQERFQLIGRNWGYEWEQIQDDIDYGLLLRPAGHLSTWNVQ
jgi:hypothetical protein